MTVKKIVEQTPIQTGRTDAGTAAGRAGPRAAAHDGEAEAADRTVVDRTAPVERQTAPTDRRRPRPTAPRADAAALRLDLRSGRSRSASLSLSCCATRRLPPRRRLPLQSRRPRKRRLPRHGPTAGRLRLRAGTAASIRGRPRRSWSALVFTVVYLIWQPRTVDLAAHTFRADLFGEEGFTIWNGQWYGGHHTPAYSVLSPPLAWLLGPPLALALAAMASAALFPPLAARLVRRRARPLGRDLVRRRHRHAALHQPAAVRDRRGVRPGGAARAPAPPLLARDPVRRALPARQPGRRAVPRDGGRGLRDRRAQRPREALGGAGDRRRGVPPAGLHVLGVPGGRLGAVPDLGLRADPAVRARVPDRPAARAERPALGRGPLRPRRHARAASRDADGRQRRAPRRAVRRAGAAVRALGPARGRSARGRCRSSRPASPRSPSGSGRPPCAT